MVIDTISKDEVDALAKSLLSYLSHYNQEHKVGGLGWAGWGGEVVDRLFCVHASLLSSSSATRSRRAVGCMCHVGTPLRFVRMLLRDGVCFQHPRHTAASLSCFAAAWGVRGRAALLGPAGPAPQFN